MLYPGRRRARHLRPAGLLRRKPLPGQCPPGAEQQYLDVDLGEAERAGDLGHREVLDIAQPEDLELLRGEMLAGPVPQIFQELTTLRIIGGRRVDDGFLAYSGSPPGLSAQMVHPFVPGHRVEPG